MSNEESQAAQAAQGAADAAQGTADAAGAGQEVKEGDVTSADRLDEGAVDETEQEKLDESAAGQ